MDYFKMQIASGHYQPGVKIPSRRELATQLKINLNTVQRAYREMELLKMIFTEPNTHSRVTKDKAMIQKMKEDILSDALKQMIVKAHHLNIPLNDLQELVANNYQMVSDQSD